jgi:hydrogenase maturation protease
VQELYEKFDALIVLDAVDLGRAPGTVLTIRPEIAVPHGIDDLADMHYATPERALMLANAVGVLPETVWLVGCQPRDRDAVGEGLSAEVAAAVEPAVGEVRRLLADLASDAP